MGRWLILILLVSVGCVAPSTTAYREMYSHLNAIPTFQNNQNPSPYFLVILVDARHLDYTQNRSLLKTLCKHPSDWSKNGDVGHAWIYLQGTFENRVVVLEGGHSGECGYIQAKYFEGVMDYAEAGDDNPVRYLW